MTRTAWTMILPVLAAGCATMAPPPPPTGPCAIGEPLRMRFIGVKFKERMRQEIEHDANARVSRILRPGDAATMDRRPDRLTIMLDDDGQIEGLRCG